MLDEFELDNEAHIADDATSPLAAEADYGWPIEQPNSVHAGSR
jgi:hypothetical protein